MPSSSSLKGKRIFITGGGKGIGRAMAHICAAEGALVAICSRTRSDLDETVATCCCPDDDAAKNIDTYVADITNVSDVEAMVTKIVEKWGAVDVLINNAGTGQSAKGPAYTLSSEDFARVLQLNVVALHTVTSAVIRLGMLLNNSDADTIGPPDCRHIVNITSKGGKVGIAQTSFYCSSKFCVEGYTATLAKEVKPHNIMVNTISPGRVNTEGFPKPPGYAGVRSPESIRDGLLLILTSQNITGQYLHVDELDQVRDVKGEGNDCLAFKPIDEPEFKVE